MNTHLLNGYRRPCEKRRSGMAWDERRTSSPSSRSCFVWEPSIQTQPCWEFHRIWRWWSGSTTPCDIARTTSHSSFSPTRCSRTMYWRSCECAGTSALPPAERIAAVAPVAVAIQSPEDHALKDRMSSSASAVSKCRRVDEESTVVSPEGAADDGYVTCRRRRSKRNRDTAAGDGCATRTSLRAGGKRVSESVERTVTAILCRSCTSWSRSPRRINGSTEAMSCVEQ
mmetsp:Transcript_23060/g.91450  ORF Transcript_23060/g.91450 Transcript_23060/m.91450 type:complete len:227 (+) Transcript_23060:203-883(+)